MALEKRMIDVALEKGITWPLMSSGQILPSTLYSEIDFRFFYLSKAGDWAMGLGQQTDPRQFWPIWSLVGILNRFLDYNY